MCIRDSLQSIHTIKPISFLQNTLEKGFSQMKKFLSVLCAAALSAGVLAGCGGSGSNGNKVEEGASSIKIGLRCV